MIKKNKQLRAYNVKHLDGSVTVVGGKSAGRYRSMAKSATKRTTRSSNGTPNWFKILILVTVFSGLWMVADMSNKKEPVIQTVSEKIETQTVQASEPIKVETVKDKIVRIFGDESDNAIKIFTCESNLDPNVIGDTNTKYPSVGVAQIRMLPGRNLKVADMLDADKNLEYAKGLFDAQSWNPWSCRKVVK